jgi:hypothetical protein
MKFHASFLSEIANTFSNSWIQLYSRRHIRANLSHRSGVITSRKYYK